MSSKFSPDDFDAAMVTDGLVFTRAKVEGSLYERWYVAISRKRTTVEPSVLIGRSNISSIFEIKPGNLTANRPAPVSKLPAVTNLLLSRTAATN